MDFRISDRIGGVSCCYICGGKSLELLEQLTGDHSATTDGQLLRQRLQKYQCLDCTLIQSNPTNVLNSDTFSGETTYDFYSKPLMRAFDKERYQNYANWVSSFLGQCQPQSVLEIGCGQAWVLELLQEVYPSIRFHGLEPSASATRHANEAGIQVQQGNVHSHSFSAGQFDFVYCINVLEHVSDPIGFLRQVSGLLANDGAALIICPCSNVIDPELLFADHLYSYSRENLQRLAMLSDLVTSAWQQGPGMLYPFQALFCGKGPLEISFAGNARIAWWPDEILPSGRRDYLWRWSILDDKLLERLAPVGDVVCFGAGETSDLLRANAPRCWEAVRGYMIDRPAGADAQCQLLQTSGLQVRFTDDYGTDEFGGILLGVKPRYQGTISERLRIFGKPVVRWDDVV